MPRVIDARERIRAAGEHADDVLLAAQVPEGHHTAAGHHHFERLVARPRLDHDARVHRTGSRAALLVVPRGGQMHAVLQMLDGCAVLLGVCRVRAQACPVGEAYLWVWMRVWIPRAALRAR